MKIVDIVKKSSRSLKSAKARTLLTAFAIAVGAFALTLTLAASRGAEQFVGKVINDNFDPNEVIVVKDETALGRGDINKPIEYDDSLGQDSVNGAARQIKQLTSEDIKEIRSTEGIEEVREGVLLSLLYVTRPEQKKFAVSLAAFSPAQKPDLLAGSIPKPLANKNVVIPEGYLSVLGFSDAQAAIGQRLQFAVRKPIDQKALQEQISSAQINPESIKLGTRLV